MSTTDAPVVTGAEDAGHDDHPTPSVYVRIAIILAILTALEISAYFFDYGALGVPLLIALMVIKFIYVGSWFMHLKFDTKIYSAFLYGGLGLAIVLYIFTVFMLYARNAA